MLLDFSSVLFAGFKRSCRSFILLSALSALFLLSSSADAKEEQSIKNFGEGALNKIPEECKPFFFAPEKDLKWFEDAKFGIFICWGPCSLAETEIGWGRYGARPGVPNPAKGGVPEDEYNNLYKKFNPVDFNAEEWIKMVKDSGAKYIIFLTKHHDGFCMFDAENSDYKVTNTPFKRDVTKELVDACHKYDIKIFLYYSQPDWHHPDYLTKHHEKYRKYFYEHMKQLLTKYGKIDGVWFDCLNTSWRHWNTPELVKMIRELQPGILINSRWGWGMPGFKKNGDFDNPEQKIGMFMIDRPWESCITMGQGWSWRGKGNLMSADDCIRILVRCVGQGGNLALDCGPRPDGKIDPAAQKNYLKIGKWLKHFGYSIYGTRGGPYKPGLYGVSTRKGDRLYLHLSFHHTDNGSLVISLPPLPAKVLSAKVDTGTLNKPVSIPVINSAEKLSIDLSGVKLNPVDTVVELKLDMPADKIAVIDPLPSERKVQCKTIKASSEYNKGFTIQNLLSKNKGKFEAGIHKKAYWVAKGNDKSPWIEFEFPKIETINGMSLAEPRRRCNIQAFNIEYDDNGVWKKLYNKGEKIGSVFSLIFKPVKTGKLRMNILKFKDTPALSDFKIFRSVK